MEKERSVPETRLLIHQPCISDVPTSVENSDSLRINFDSLSSHITPGIHHSNERFPKNYTTIPQIYGATINPPVIQNPPSIIVANYAHRSNSNEDIGVVKQFEPFIKTIQKPSLVSPSKCDAPIQPRSPDKWVKNYHPVVPSTSNGHNSVYSIVAETNRIDTKPYLIPPKLDLHMPAEHLQPDYSRPQSPDELTCDSGLGDLSICEEDRLRRQTAFLEGRLSVYGKEAETWLRERAELSMEAASLRKRLEVAQANHDDIKMQTKLEIGEANANLGQVQKEHNATKTQLLQNHQTIENLNSTLNSVYQESSNLRSQLADAQLNNATKDQAISSLKAKMSELYADVESFRYKHSQALDTKTDLSAELSSMKRSQEWYGEQLQVTQAARDRLQNELAAMRRWLDQGGTSAKQLAQENARLETQVMSREAALAEAKRNLSKQLETIRDDIVEREAIFEKIAAERSSLEALCQHKSNQINECQIRIAQLQSDLIEAENDAAGQKSALDKLKQTLQLVEYERENLHISVINLEEQLSKQKISFDEHVAQYVTVCNKVSFLETKTTNLDNGLSQALEEKATVEGSLQTLSKEKSALDSCLNQLKDDMQRVESNFSALQFELEAKNSDLSSLLLARDELSSDLEVLQATLQEKSNNIDAVNAEKEQMQNTLLSLQTENEGLRDEIKQFSVSLKSAKAALTPACENAMKKAREPLIAELAVANAENETLHATIQAMQGQIDSILADQERHCALIENYNKLQHQYDSLLAKYTSATKQAEISHIELSNRLQQTEAHYEKTLTAKSAEIDALTQQLGDKITEVFGITSELANAKKTHQEALGEQANKWAYRQSELETRLTLTEAQRVEIEQTLNTTLQHERETIIQYQKELASYKEAVSRLESRAAIAEGFEQKHHQLQSELEATRGREMGLNDIVGELKRHTATLENALSRREEKIAELADKADRQGETLEWTQCQIQKSADIIVPVQDIQVTASPPPVCSACPDLSAKVTWYADNVLKMQHEVAQARAALDLAKQDLAAESVKAINERVAKEEALNGRRTALADVDRLNNELTCVKNHLAEMQQAVQLSQIDVCQLRDKTDSHSRSTSAEVQALQSVIRAMTNHLEMLKNELTDTKNEAWVAQSALANLRGSLRGLIERHQMLENVGSSAIDCAFNTVDIGELEILLAERSEDPLHHSKPLARVSNFLNILQQEINSLEEQVVHHASVVNDSVANWRSIEEESLLLRTQPSPMTNRR